MAWDNVHGSTAGNSPGLRECATAKRYTTGRPDPDPEVKGEPAATAKSFTPAEKKDYEKKTAEELAAIQEKIAELRVKATSGAPQQKRTLILAANNLQFQKVAAGNRLAALEKAPEQLGASKKPSWIRLWSSLGSLVKEPGYNLNNAGLLRKVPGSGRSDFQGSKDLASRRGRKETIGNFT